jgi:hypothetical protein
VAESYLAIRQRLLRQSQNPDGGWGYFPGKQSWLEPTAYAGLVLHGEPAADRAWHLLCSWQGASGSLRPSAEVQMESWGTALWLIMAAARGESGPEVQAAVDWLLGMRGAETTWFRRVTAQLRLYHSDRNLNFEGWPWKPDNSAWVEPTAHSLVALKQIAMKRLSPKSGSSQLSDRIQLGESQLLDLRCSDGGWNYGSREVLNRNLPSYPETTGVALVGLQGRTGLEASLDLAARLAQQVGSDRGSPMAASWLSIALRFYGRKDSLPQNSPVPEDLHEVALEALAAPEGNFEFFKTGVTV